MKRSRRKIQTKMPHDKKYELIKALDSKINQEIFMRKPHKNQPQKTETETNSFRKNTEGRKKRDTDDGPNRIKSLQQIINEFKNTRDEIQSNFEWKYYNITELELASPAQTTTHYTPTISNAVTEAPNQCACQLGIFIAVGSFGALIAIAYAIFKFIQHIRRGK